MEKQIKEDVEVLVKENENKIKDFVFSLNTSQSGKANYTTELVNGELCGIIITTISPIKVKIYLFNHPEIVLFEMVNYYGDSYIPLRLDAVSYLGEHIRDSNSCWFLNDNLVCETEGAFNTETKFIIRYK